MTEYRDLANMLANRITGDRSKLQLSGAYYDALYRPEAVGIGTPEALRVLMAYVGWSRTYLDAIEERLDLEDFRVAGQTQGIDELRQWWQDNDLDEESSIAHLEAMIYGRAFVTVAAPSEDDDNPDSPLIRVESPLNMCVERDFRTGKITQALRLYTNGTKADGAKATLFLPNETVYLKKGDKTAYGNWELDGDYGDEDTPGITKHGLGIVPVEQITNRARSANRNGKSEITPEIRSVTDAGCRMMMNMQTTSELLATPQRVFFGVSPEELAGNGSPAEILDAYIGHITAIENADAKAMQFLAAELRNYTEGLGELARHMTSYTGLPPAYFGIQSDNPPSADAIRMAEARLVKKAERKQRFFGASWERVMRIAMRVMDKEVPVEWNRLEAVWRDPSTPTFAAKADAVQKLFANGEGILNKEFARMELGYGDQLRKDMRKWDDKDRLNFVVGVPAERDDEAA